MHPSHPRTLPLPAFGAALLLLAAAAPLVAQGPVSAGTRSISFGLGDRVEAGIWTTLSSGTRVGLLGSFQYESASVETPGSSSDSDRTRFQVGPAAKWYTGGTAAVRPFWFGAARVGVDSRETEDRTWNFGMTGAFGADWFPNPQLSIGGYTGLGLDVGRRTRGDRTDSSTAVSTFTTGLQMHIYF